jgi:hypothetical protein
MVEVLGRYLNTPDLPQFRRTERVPTRERGPVVHCVRKRLSLKQIQQLVRDYEAGTPSTTLMVRYGLCKGTVLNLLRAEGVGLRAHGLAATDLPEAIQLYINGLSLARLGSKFDCDAETVWKRLIGAGVVTARMGGDLISHSTITPISF